MIDVHSKAEMAEIIEKPGVHIFLFTAFWCPDCMYIKPFLPELEDKYGIEFNMMNRDECMDIAQELDIMGIPSFVAYKDGKEITRFVSSLRKTKAEIEDYLNKTLESGGAACH